jgi:hypothetical protein
MWLKYLFQALQFIPFVVAGIEHIHGEAPGATKKQMAIDALGLASTVASGVLPEEHQAAVAAATELASTTIDGVVKTFNAAGVFQKGKPVAAALTDFAPVRPIAAVPAPAAMPTVSEPAAPATDDVDRAIRQNRGD